jgi:hypothetical protein
MLLSELGPVCLEGQNAPFGSRAEKDEQVEELEGLEFGRPFLGISSKTITRARRKLEF